MAGDADGARPAEPAASARQELWGPETAKAVENFPVSGDRVPAPVLHWLGGIKAAAARTPSWACSTPGSPSASPGRATRLRPAI